MLCLGPTQKTARNGFHIASIQHVDPLPRAGAEPLLLTWPLGVAADNFDFIRLDRTRVVQLEVDVLDQKSPNLVAETVRIQMTLCSLSESASQQPRQTTRRGVHVL